MDAKLEIFYDFISDAAIAIDLSSQGKGQVLIPVKVAQEGFIAYMRKLYNRPSCSVFHHEHAEEAFEKLKSSILKNTGKYLVHIEKENKVFLCDGSTYCKFSHLH